MRQAMRKLIINGFNLTNWWHNLLSNTYQPAKIAWGGAGMVFFERTTHKKLFNYKVNMDQGERRLKMSLSTIFQKYVFGGCLYLLWYENCFLEKQKITCRHCLHFPLTCFLSLFLGIIILPADDYRREAGNAISGWLISWQYLHHVVIYRSFKVVYLRSRFRTISKSWAELYVPVCFILLFAFILYYSNNSFKAINFQMHPAQ